MRVLFAVQRYGPEVAGGAERHCRQFAIRLAARGHEVEVLTTCALSYVDWENVLPPGPELDDGVLVHRLPVARPRDNHLFAELNARVLTSVDASYRLQRTWMEMQGPLVPGLRPWLEGGARAYDVVVFFTYLYFTTWAGLAACAGRVPTVLHPTAHDEPAFWLPVFDLTFHQPRAFAFSTEEEEALVRRRSRTHRPSAVIGVGTDLDGRGDAAAFRAAYGLGDRPYLLFVGRLDPGKGSDEVHSFFTTYKSRRPGDLTLVVVGDPVKPLAPHPDVVVTGFLDPETVAGAYAGALALVQPSYFESFSMVLTEAWAHRLPALVQGRCEVLAGQARRSGGGIPYSGYAEFEAALDLLLEDAGLRRRLGEAGRAYVEAHYEWSAVMDRYEAFLERVVTAA